MMFGKGAETRFWPSKIKQQQKKAKKKNTKKIQKDEENRLKKLGNI